MSRLFIYIYINLYIYNIYIINTKIYITNIYIIYIYIIYIIYIKTNVNFKCVTSNVWIKYTYTYIYIHSTGTGNTISLPKRQFLENQSHPGPF